MTDPAPRPDSSKPESNVDRITAQLRRMAAEFEIKPDERIREGEMAKRLSVSRTPLREALNRLVSEGFLTFTGGQGFFCRSLTPERILDLYEARAAVELDQTRVGRLSRMDALQGQAMALETDRRRGLELQKIEGALRRLEDGEYGACVRCGEEVEVKRLELDPAATLCFDCASSG